LIEALLRRERGGGERRAARPARRLAESAPAPPAPAPPAPPAPAPPAPPPAPPAPPRPAVPLPPSALPLPVALPLLRAVTKRIFSVTCHLRQQRREPAECLRARATCGGETGGSEVPPVCTGLRSRLVPGLCRRGAGGAVGGSAHLQECGEDETCPLSTGIEARHVHLVRG